MSKAKSDLIDDLKLLGELKHSKNDENLIDEDYFVDLVALLTFHTKKECQKERSSLLKQRRHVFFDLKNVQMAMKSKGVDQEKEKLLIQEI